jgi:hypothetical protein
MFATSIRQPDNPYGSASHRWTMDRNSRRSS